MSSPPPPPPSGSPPPPPPSGAPPPPPPPPPPPSITSANYFFAFVITFVVLLLVFIGCGLGSWRRLRLIGTAWDVQLQDMDGNPFGARKRARRRLVRPTFQDTWTAPTLSAAHLTSSYRWAGVQVSPSPPWHAAFPDRDWEPPRTIVVAFVCFFAWVSSPVLVANLCRAGVVAVNTDRGRGSTQVRRGRVDDVEDVRTETAKRGPFGAA